MLKRNKKNHVYVLTFSTMVGEREIKFERYITTKKKVISVSLYEQMISAVKEKEGLSEIVLINSMYLGKK